MFSSVSSEQESLAHLYQLQVMIMAKLQTIYDY